MQVATIATHEGFDLDLYSWFPEAKEIIKPVADGLLFTFGRVDENGRLVSVTYWNGPGCLFFSSPLVCLPDENGWLNYRGFTTKDSLICVPAEIAIRHLFVQGYQAGLDDYLWTGQHNLSLDLCYFIRRKPVDETKLAASTKAATAWLERMVCLLKRNTPQWTESDLAYAYG